MPELHGLGFALSLPCFEPFSIGGNLTAGFADQRTGAHSAGAGTNDPVVGTDPAIRELGFLEQPVHLFQLLIQRLQLKQRLDDRIGTVGVQSPVFGVFNGFAQVNTQSLLQLVRAPVILNPERLLHLSRQALPFAESPCSGVAC